MRLLPAVPTFSRITTQEELIPLGHPLTLSDGAVVDKLLLPARTEILGCLSDYNTSPEVWGEDADEYNPDRFLRDSGPTLPGQLMAGSFGGTLSFLTGPRTCLGWRLSAAEMQVVLAHLLASFRFEPREPNMKLHLCAFASPLGLRLTRAQGQCANHVGSSGRQVADSPSRVVLVTVHLGRCVDVSRASWSVKVRILTFQHRHRDSFSQPLSDQHCDGTNIGNYRYNSITAASALSAAAKTFKTDVEASLLTWQSLRCIQSMTVEMCSYKLAIYGRERFKRTA